MTLLEALRLCSVAGVLPSYDLDCNCEMCVAARLLEDAYWRALNDES